MNPYNYVRCHTRARQVHVGEASASTIRRCGSAQLLYHGASDVRRTQTQPAKACKSVAASTRQCATQKNRYASRSCGSRTHVVKRLTSGAQIECTRMSIRCCSFSPTLWSSSMRVPWPSGLLDSVSGAFAPPAPFSTTSSFGVEKRTP